MTTFPVIQAQGLDQAGLVQAVDAWTGTVGVYGTLVLTIPSAVKASGLVDEGSGSNARAMSIVSHLPSMMVSSDSIKYGFNMCPKPLPNTIELNARVIRMVTYNGWIVSSNKSIKDMDIWYINFVPPSEAESDDGIVALDLREMLLRAMLSIEDAYLDAIGAGPSKGYEMLLKEKADDMSWISRVEKEDCPDNIILLGKPGLVVLLIPHLKAVLAAKRIGTRRGGGLTLYTLTAEYSNPDLMIEGAEINNGQLICAGPQLETELNELLGEEIYNGRLENTAFMNYWKGKNFPSALFDVRRIPTYTFKAIPLLEVIGLIAFVVLMLSSGSVSNTFGSQLILTTTAFAISALECFWYGERTSSNLDFGDNLLTRAASDSDNMIHVVTNKLKPLLSDGMSVTDEHVKILHEMYDQSIYYEHPAIPGLDIKSERLRHVVWLYATLDTRYGLTDIVLICTAVSWELAFGLVLDIKALWLCASVSLILMLWTKTLRWLYINRSSTRLWKTLHGTIRIWANIDMFCMEITLALWSTVLIFGMRVGYAGFVAVWILIISRVIKKLLQTKDTFGSMDLEMYIGNELAGIIRAIITFDDII